MGPSFFGLGLLELFMVLSATAIGMALLIWREFLREHRRANQLQQQLDQQQQGSSQNCCKALGHEN